MKTSPPKVASYFRLIDFYPLLTSHSAYVATETELYGAKIDGLWRFRDVGLGP